MNVYYPKSFEVIGCFKSCVKQVKTKQSRDLLVPIFVYCSVFQLFWSDIVVLLLSKWFSMVSTSDGINRLSLERSFTSPNKADLRSLDMEPFLKGNVEHLRSDHDILTEFFG